MKLIRAYKHKRHFHLAPREKQLFVRVLKLYPRIPAAHQRLSKTSPLPEPEESQRLLDDALAEQRTALKKQIRAIFASRSRLKATKTGWRLSLSGPEIEWLLQILNDIRVGSWLSLGSPEDIHKAFNPATAPDFWAMEICGVFQNQILEALNPVQ